MDTFWWSILQAVLVALLPPLAVALFRFAWAKGSKAWAEFQASQPDWSALIQTAARVAVKAAEEANLGGIIDDKKKYALEVAEAWLTMHKCPVDLHVIDAAIESAVWDEFNKWREPELPEPEE